MPHRPPDNLTMFDALTTRRSVRAFLPTRVKRETVEQILTLASRAPSGSNIQPWKVWALSGTALGRLTRRLMAAHETESSAHVEEFQYYPRTWREPYLSRRRKLGKDLYGLLGLAKGDQEAMKRQFGRNYIFFGAPVGLIVTIERDMECCGWIDVGGFIHGITLAARGFGLHTCPQQAFSQYHRIIRDELGIPEQQLIVCGVALGHEDSDAPENQLITERNPVDTFTTFHWD